MPDSGDEFPCVNEDYGLECEYPFCNCEGDFYEDKVEDLTELFERNIWPTEYEGEWLEDDE